MAIIRRWTFADLSLTEQSQNLRLIAEDITSDTAEIRIVASNFSDERSNIVVAVRPIMVDKNIRIRVQINS